jgi:hypothetical protein
MLPLLVQRKGGLFYRDTVHTYSSRLDQTACLLTAVGIALLKQIQIGSHIVTAPA